MNPLKLVGGLIKFVVSVFALGLAVMIMFMAVGLILFIAALV